MKMMSALRVGLALMLVFPRIHPCLSRHEKMLSGGLWATNARELLEKV